ncbi:MAG: response regulator transcription factor [Magnetovibrio sp.]|nr:response regulator transcription factor [Magnetovibrio sp.]
MVRVILADDHTIFRQGLISLLEGTPNLEIIADVGTGLEAWDLIQQEQPDIAVLDFRMPGLNGIEIAEKIKQEKLPCKVVLLTMHDDPSLIYEARSVDVAGYVLKDNAFENLVSVVVTIAEKQLSNSPRVAPSLTCSANNNRKLSKRERLVLTSIAEGNTNKEIAKTLDISPKTVETHRSRIMEKLDLHSIAELTRHAMRVGLID